MPQSFIDELIVFGRYSIAAIDPQIPGTAPVCSYCKLGSVPSVNVLSVFHNHNPKALGYVGVDHSRSRVILIFGPVIGAQIKLVAQDIFPRRWPRELPGSYVYEGLVMTYEAIRDRVIRQTEDAVKKYPNYELVMIGHSQGAAYTTFALYDLATKHPDWKITAIPSGSPRVGNTVFAEAVNKLKNVTIYRTTYKRDAIVHVPPIEEFVHINTEYFYTDDNQIIKCNSYEPYGEDPNCSDRYTCDELNEEDHAKYLSEYF